MKKEHTIILILIVITLVLAIMLVAHKPKAEHFYLTDDQKSKLCKMQAQMVVDAPYIGGSFDKVYDNCMKGDLQVMPSAYASIH